MKEVKNDELVEKIIELKKNKNAIILAHYYQTADIQEIAVNTRDLASIKKSLNSMVEYGIKVK